MTLFDRLRRKAEFYQQGPEWVRSIWPTENSFAWFLKSHTQELEKLLAIRKVGRDWFIDTNHFPEAAARVWGLPVDDGIAQRTDAAV